MNPHGRAIVDEGPQMNPLPSQQTKTSPVGELEESQLMPNPATTELENDELWPLSGKPYCHVILTKSHVKPNYHMIFPAKLHSVLPGGTVPAIVTYGNKSWNTTFYGSGRHKRFHISWKKFVIDNSLEVGDALVFEVLESSNTLVKLRVQILRGDFPSELLERVNGETSQSPIVLD